MWGQRAIKVYKGRRQFDSVVTYKMLVWLRGTTCNCRIFKICFVLYRTVINIQSAMVLSPVIFFVVKIILFFSTVVYILSYLSFIPDRIQCASVISYLYLSLCLYISSPRLYYGVLYSCRTLTWILSILK